MDYPPYPSPRQRYSDGSKKIDAHIDPDRVKRMGGGLDVRNLLRNDPSLTWHDAEELARINRSLGKRVAEDGMREEDDIFVNAAMKRGGMRQRYAPTRADRVQEAIDDGTFEEKRRRFNANNKDVQLDEFGDRVAVTAPVRTSVREQVAPMRTAVAGALGGLGSAVAQSAINAARRSPEEATDPSASITGMLDSEEVRNRSMAQNRQRLQEGVDAKKRLREMSIGQSDVVDAKGNTVARTSKYGTGSVTMLSPEQMETRAPAMVKNDFGQMVPLAGEIARKKYVQSTKAEQEPDKFGQMQRKRYTQQG